MIKNLGTLFCISMILENSKKMFSKSSVKLSLCVLGHMAKKQARPLTQSKIWP